MNLKFSCCLSEIERREKHGFKKILEDENMILSLFKPYITSLQLSENGCGYKYNLHAIFIERQEHYNTV